MLPRPEEKGELASPEIIDEAASSMGEDDGYDVTVHSMSEVCPQGTQPPTPAPQLTESEEPKRGFAYRFLRFFFHSGIPSFCLRTLLLCAVLLGFGMLALFKFPKLEVEHVPLGYTSLILGWALLGFVTMLALMHAFVVFCHQRRLFYTWSFIHYLSELEKYMALMISIFTYLILLSFDVTQKFTDAWVFGSAATRFLAIKISLGIFITTALLAVKRHYMTALAVAFNYSNYKDRIQESLFADRVLNMLQKSRHTYKFRQKMRAQHKDGVESRMRSPSPRGRAERRDIVKSARVTQYSPPKITVQSSVKSAMEIFSPTALREQQSVSGFASVPPVVPPSPLSGPNVPGGTPPSSGFKKSSSPIAPIRSVASYLTESDKKLRFSEFFRLANKMISRFSNVADYRVEIQNESRTVAKKLYKYLLPYGRDYLLGQDLSPYIEDEEEFCRAVALIKRNAEGSYQISTMTLDEANNYAFGAQDLQRAIDGILTELYVTAKSLQTIETALDKVDFFFTLIVALVMIVIVAIVIGDAVKLLLALSTMLSGAAFAFGTSARNMFESMIFLLVIHPFDVGDRVFVPLGTTMASLATTAASMSGVDALDNLIVAEMHLLSTVFERWDGVKLYVPNYILAAKPIFNIKRSGPLLEIQRLHIDFTTPMAKVEELRRRLDEYVRREQSDYTDISRVLLDSMENCNRINLNIIFQHNTNWQDMDTQLARRSKLLAFLKETVEQLDMAYLPPVQRVALVPTTSVLGEKSAMNVLSAGEVQRLIEIAGKCKLPI
jgi:small-conductance mechanosensitive channel